MTPVIAGSIWERKDQDLFQMDRNSKCSSVDKVTKQIINWWSSSVVPHAIIHLQLTWRKI